MTPIVSATILRTQSDERLLALTRQGYERAFEAIVERYRRTMLRYCRRYLPEARAEDAVQQAFISAWSALRDGTEVGDLRPWLYRITRNAAIDAAKRAGYDYHELSEALRLTPAPDAELERRAVMRQTLSGVAELPTNQREALMRTVLEGHSRADIARDMQISEGAVRQLVHRARTALRSAATSLTPMPVVGWAVSLGGGDAPIGVRIAELAAGGGAAGGGGVLIKTGTAIVVAGVLAVEAGDRLDHPSAAAGDSGAGHRAKVAQLASTSSAHPGGRRAIRRGRAAAAWSSLAAASRTRARGAVEKSRDEGSKSSNRGPGSLSSGSGSRSGSGDDDGSRDSSGPGGGGDEGNREDNSSGPGSQPSGDDRGDGDRSGSDSDGDDGDGDHSGPGSGGDDSDGGDSDDDKSGSRDDRSESDGGDGGSGKEGSDR